MSLISIGPGAEPKRVQGFLNAWAITLGAQTFASMVACSDGRIRIVRVHANQLGTSGTTVIDLTKNGNSMYRNPASRPTLPAGEVGWFPVKAPDDQAYQSGDILGFKLVSNGGHGQVTATAALEEP